MKLGSAFTSGTRVLFELL